ncbi:hypothetical protein ONZ45_g9119 [Pleurotus djamor]|nr:hypothetical protein ONZ45_g9119 [Pleurotus djamor]
MDVCAWTAGSACQTQGLCCNGIPNNICCGGWPTAFGFSNSFTNAPLNSFYLGESFSDTQCTVFKASNDGTAHGLPTCFSNCSPFATCTPAGSAGWLLGTPVKRDALASSGAKTCMRPNAARFTNADGVQREIKIPEGAFDAAVKMLVEKDFDGLHRLSVS